MIATEKSTSWLTAFEAWNGRNSGPEWLCRRRQEAFARFWELGFPTVHHEDWRFTNVTPIANTPFALASAAHVTAEELRPHVLPDAACRLVFVNGRFTPALSDLRPLPAGAVATDLAGALAKDEAAVERHLCRHEGIGDDAFSVLNAAFLETGAYVSIPRNAVLDKPIYLLYVSVGSPTPQMTHPRNLIVVGEGAQAAIVEDYISLGSGAFFSNVVTELVVGENAVVEHYLVEREDREAYNVSTLRLQQGRSANVASHSVLLGGAIVRNNVHPVLEGEGAECLINGLFIGSGRQHLDNYMEVEHKAPHCGSRQFYNGILDQHARGVFHGRIIVHKGAQKTDAKQTNRNLLLSDTAQVDTKPQLEIYADDVKCTHGATIGQIDEEALFYLRARGLPEREARGLLLFAFAHECLGRMKAGGVREWLSRSVSAWLPKDRVETGQEVA